jgi:arylsulfatase A-like enzyme
LDFSATLRNPALSARRSLRFAYKDVQLAIRDEEWKLIDYPKVKRTQLFDLKNDPFETHDLSDSREQEARVARMRELLAQEP